MKTRECISWLWRSSEGIRLRVVAACLAGIVHVAASLAFVWVCKGLIDAVTVDRGTSLTVHIAGMVSCMLVQILSGALETRLSNHTDVILKNRHSLI